MYVFYQVEGLSCKRLIPGQENTIKQCSWRVRWPADTASLEVLPTYTVTYIFLFFVYVLLCIELLPERDTICSLTIYHSSVMLKI